MSLVCLEKCAKNEQNKSKCETFRKYKAFFKLKVENELLHIFTVKINKILPVKLKCLHLHVSEMFFVIY